MGTPGEYSTAMSKTAQSEWTPDLARIPKQAAGPVIRAGDFGAAVRSNHKNVVFPSKANNFCLRRYQYRVVLGALLLTRYH